MLFFIASKGSVCEVSKATYTASIVDGFEALISYGHMIADDMQRLFNLFLLRWLSVGQSHSVSEPSQTPFYQRLVYAEDLVGPSDLSTSS